MSGAGQRFDFRLPAPASSLDAEAAPLQRALARWVLAHGGDARLATLAMRASLADENGDSALRIEDGGMREAVQAMPLVGDARAVRDTPFVLDGELFYLRRNFSHEVAVAALLKARMQAVEAIAPDPDNAIDPSELFDAAGGAAQAGQVSAVRKVLHRDFFVLSGGPGTGKTTTVLRMLMALAEQHRTRHATWPRIALAAPTGKAARRLGESLRTAEAVHFPLCWQPALQQVQAVEPATLHRLLGSRGLRGGFAHGPVHPLPADIVVVDEASMLDLISLRALLAALAPGARLILVGDADQLDSVGTGSVLQDIVAALAEDDSRLQVLAHAYRADPRLQPLNAALRDGDLPGFDAALAEGSSQVQRHQPQGAIDLAALLEAWSDALLDDIRAARIDMPMADIDDATILRRLAAGQCRQLLCALREGPFGASGANAAIEARLAPQLQRDNALPGIWYPGRRVLVTRNDSASGLSNGDIGLCLDVGGRLQVWFEGNNREDGARVPRAFAIGSLPAHVPAFALTVHKAQGSEYDEVAVLLPPQDAHPLLSRQWLYTAISRARHGLQLWGSAAAIAHAIASPGRRVSGLTARLWRDA